MALAIHPTRGTLADIYRAMGVDVNIGTLKVAGCVSPPRNYRVPECMITYADCGSVPAAAASRLGEPSGSRKFDVNILQTVRADPGTNTALFLPAGIYETNYTIEAIDPSYPNPANYLETWHRADQRRVYFVMPQEVAPFNEAAEREHCSDMIRAYQLTLEAVDSAFQDELLRGVTKVLHRNGGEAQQAKAQRVKERLHSKLRDIAFNRDALERKFQDLLGQTGTGRDAMGYHDFGVELLEAPPRGYQLNYLTGIQRQNPSEGIYLSFTRGRTQINMHSSEKVINL